MILHQFLFWCVGVSALGPLLCAGTAENVLVVVNDNSAVSRTIGEYYVRKRSVPLRNVCRIRTTEDETIPRGLYETVVEPGVSRCLTSQKLVETILYIVTTTGVPLRIEGKGGLGGDAASVDSELTLLYGRLKGIRYSLNGIVPNPFYNRSIEFSHPDFPIYLVTRLTAYDFNGVKGIIDRALIAKNSGNFVLDATGRGTEGDDWLRNAAIQLPRARTIFDETSRVLSGLPDVLAYASYGSNDKSRRTRKLGFRYVPGAIVTEFVSTNGRTFHRPPEQWEISTSWSDPGHYYVGSPQTLSADYLDEGATGVSGHVYEPYLGFTPRPDKLLPAYYSGRNLAESFYSAIPGLSWQNIVVGDPLCSIGPGRR